MTGAVVHLSPLKFERGGIQLPLLDSSPPPSLCSRGSHRSPPADVPPPSFWRPGSGTAAIRNPSCIYIGTNVLCYHHYVANAFLQLYAWVRLHWNEWLARAQGQRTASTSCLNPLFTWKAYHFLPDSFQKPFCLIGFSPAERWINMYLHARYRIISKPLHFCLAISSLQATSHGSQGCQTQEKKGSCKKFSYNLKFC